MMDIRTNFHKLIDQVDNKDLLENFYAALNYYVNKKEKIDILDQLTEKQRKRLDASIEQALNGQTISNKQMKNEFKQWLSK